MGGRMSSQGYVVRVLGKPHGKDRPRFCAGHAYTTSKTKTQERLFAQSWKDKYPDVTLEGALAVSIKFYFPTNKSDSKKNAKRKIDGDIKCTVKPDIDNLIKAVLDGLNGVAFVDDKQVVSITAIKGYSDEPETIVYIKEI